MSAQYGELRPTSGWDPLASLGHPNKFQRLSRLGSVTARHSSSGRQQNFAALNRGRHLHSTGRPSRWALAHISSTLLWLYPHKNHPLYLTLVRLPLPYWWQNIQNSSTQFLLCSVVWSRCTAMTAFRGWGLLICAMQMCSLFITRPRPACTTVSAALGLGRSASWTLDWDNVAAA